MTAPAAGRHPARKGSPAQARTRLLRWADETDRMADQLHRTVCRLRSTATRYRQEAQQ